MPFMHVGQECHCYLGKSSKAGCRFSSIQSLGIPLRYRDSRDVEFDGTAIQVPALLLSHQLGEVQVTIPNLRFDKNVL